MNRREVLLGLAGLPLVGWPTEIGAATVKPIKVKAKKGVPPPIQIKGLPEGLGELTIEGGDITVNLELMVPSTGTIMLRYGQARELLEGLWEVRKPGTFVANWTPTPGVPSAPLTLGTFPDLTDSFVVPNITKVVWVYRHPNYTGTYIVAPLGGQLKLRVDSGAGEIPALDIDFVDYDVWPIHESELSALAYPPLPQVRRIITSWQIPPGKGRRDFEIDPIEIPWNAKLLGLIRRTPVTQTIDVRLTSTNNRLAISPTKPDPPSGGEPAWVYVIYECRNPSPMPGHPSHGVHGPHEYWILVPNPTTGAGSPQYGTTLPVVDCTNDPWDHCGRSVVFSRLEFNPANLGAAVQYPQ